MSEPPLTAMAFWVKSVTDCDTVAVTTMGLSPVGVGAAGETDESVTVGGSAARAGSALTKSPAIATAPAALREKSRLLINMIG